MTKSEILYREAKKYIPGGVNSPVRAFNSVGLNPVFIKSANGSKIVDVDDNEYIDYVCSWGPMILGHNHEAIVENVKKACENGLSYGAATKIEVDMAMLICEIVPSIESVRMVNSGTEAVMSAIRVARGFTGKDKIIKFIGCYHGHSDALLVKAGSGAMTSGVPDSAGVPRGCTQDTLTVNYNDLEGVKNLFTKYKGEIAGIIVEPVPANMGLVLPKEGFLEGLRKLCNENNVVLIFDEVITGFRLGIDGAQGYLGVTPDLTTFGKIIGAGMPVGAYGGKKEIMDHVAPVGKVYQAGTLSGNPIAMTAGYTLLKLLKDGDYYTKLNHKSEEFFNEVRNILKKASLPYIVNSIGSLGSIFFTDKEVYDYNTALTSDTSLFATYFKKMLYQGIYIAPSQFEALFISVAHDENDIEKTLEAIKKSL